MLPGVTLCSTPPDSSDICLQPRQFDFYAQAVVDRKQLRKDSTTLELMIKSQYVIIEQKDIQIQSKDAALVVKDSIAGRYKSAYKAVEKKLRTFKNLSLILGSCAVILLGVLLLVI